MEVTNPYAHDNSEMPDLEAIWELTLPPSYRHEHRIGDDTQVSNVPRKTRKGLSSMNWTECIGPVLMLSFTLSVVLAIDSAVRKRWGGKR